MAKTSQVLRDQRRAKLIAKYAARRAELRERLKDPNVSTEEKFEIQIQFARLPRNSCPTRLTPPLPADGTCSGRVSEVRDLSNRTPRDDPVR